MIAIPYRGHYVTHDGRTVYVAKDLDPDAVALGDNVQIGEVVVRCDGVERWTGNTITGLVVRQ